MVGAVCKRQMPVVGGGTGIWSFCEVTDAAAAVAHGAPGIYSVVDDDPAPVRELGWAPRYASWRDGFRDWAKTAGQAHAA